MYLKYDYIYDSCQLCCVVMKRGVKYQKKIFGHNNGEVRDGSLHDEELRYLSRVKVTWYHRSEMYEAAMDQACLWVGRERNT
jgi:hypothetical protein